MELALRRMVDCGTSKVVNGARSCRAFWGDNMEPARAKHVELEPFSVRGSGGLEALSAATRIVKLPFWKGCAEG